VNGNTCGGGIAMSPDPLITNAGRADHHHLKLVGDWQFDPKNGMPWSGEGLRRGHPGERHLDATTPPPRKGLALR
jgi:hypothetical protein